MHKEPVPGASFCIQPNDTFNKLFFTSVLLIAGIISFTSSLLLCAAVLILDITLLFFLLKSSYDLYLYDDHFIVRPHFKIFGTTQIEQAYSTVRDVRIGFGTRIASGFSFSYSRKNRLKKIGFKCGRDDHYLQVFQFLIDRNIFVCCNDDDFTSEIYDVSKVHLKEKHFSFFGATFYYGEKQFNKTTV
jgi:hypothetical protein